MTDKLVERLRERAANARAETTATALGDALHFEEAADALEAQQARIVELEAEARRWEAGAEAEAKANWSTRVASQGMQARIRALEEALKPFAKEAAHWGDYRDDVTLVEDIPGYDGFIRVCDLRRAKQVLEGK